MDIAKCTVRMNAIDICKAMLKFVKHSVVTPFLQQMLFRQGTIYFQIPSNSIDM